MRLTTKGQVTIPKEVREYLSLVPYDEVDFLVENGQVILVKSNRTVDHFQEYLQKIRGKGTITMSTDEIMQLTRDE